MVRFFNANIQVFNKSCLKGLIASDQALTNEGDDGKDAELSRGDQGDGRGEEPVVGVEQLTDQSQNQDPDADVEELLFKINQS